MQARDTNCKYLSLSTLMFIADCINKVFFFALHYVYTSSATHKHTLHDNSSLYFFLLSLPFMDLRRQSFTADAMSFAYHIGDLINYFKQQPLLSHFQPSSSSSIVRSSSVSTKDLCWPRKICLLLNGKTAVI